MRVGVIGTGHVGLVTCGTFAALGYDVVGMDNDESKIESLRNGIAPFYEPGLQELLESEIATGRLSFTASMAEAVDGADVVFICVGTPPRADGEASLVAVEQAAQAVARHARGRLVVVEKSTVPAGTAQRVKRTLLRERRGAEFQLAVASNPEFLREGKAVEDSLNPERILVGAESEWALEILRKLYAPLTEKGARLIETDISTAELAKHACNAFLAMKISFANALARICELAGADVVDIAEVMGSDSRIGPQFLRAGIGYGGFCFPKDVAAFETLASKLGYDFGMLREVAKINDQAIEAAARKVKDALWNLEDKRIALLGLAFKPGTDDVRFAPALALAGKLRAEGAEVVGYDPVAADEARKEMPDLKVMDDLFEAVDGAHCVVICTEWKEFQEIDLDRLREAMAYPVVVDGRNIYDAIQMGAAGFSYYPTGRPAQLEDAWPARDEIDEGVA